MPAFWRKALPRGPEGEPVGRLRGHRRQRLPAAGGFPAGVCGETAASLSMIAGAEIDRAALETAFLEELEALRRELPQETAERRSGVRSRLSRIWAAGSECSPRRRAGGTGGVPDTGLRPCGAL
ncbi:MAG: hypothetical protein ACLU38_15170 [Dysosmobacter sp.]